MPEAIRYLMARPISEEPPAVLPRTLPDRMNGRPSGRDRPWALPL